MKVLITSTSGRTQEFTWVTSCVRRADVVTLYGLGGVVLDTTHCKAIAEITIKEDRA